MHLEIQLQEIALFNAQNYLLAGHNIIMEIHRLESICVLLSVPQLLNYSEIMILIYA